MKKKIIKKIKIKKNKEKRGTFEESHSTKPSKNVDPFVTFARKKIIPIVPPNSGPSDLLIISIPFKKRGRDKARERREKGAKKNEFTEGR